MTLWSLMPGDFLQDVSPAAIAAVVGRRVSPGDIVVLHEGLPDALETAERVVATLLDAGHRLAALPDPDGVDRSGGYGTEGSAS